MLDITVHPNEDSACQPPQKLLNGTKNARKIITEKTASNTIPINSASTKLIKVSINNVYPYLYILILSFVIILLLNCLFKIISTAF